VVGLPIGQQNHPRHRLLFAALQLQGTGEQGGLSKNRKTTHASAFQNACHKIK
jgi:hypothetical protein